MFNKILKSKYKLILALLAVFIIQNISNATTTACKNVCPETPYDIGSFFSRGIQNVSGLNFLATKFAESMIKQHIKKYAQGEVEVTVDSFSAGDLAAGKLKKLEIIASAIEFDDVFVSSFEAKSLCDFIQIDYKSKPVALIEPLNIAFKGVLSEEDLNKTVSSSKYLKKITNIQINNKKIKFVNFTNPKIDLIQGRMIMTSNLLMPGMIIEMLIPIKIDAGLAIINNKIQIVDAKLASNIFKINLDFPPSVYEKINPILYNLAEVETNGKKISFEKVTISDDQINVEGSLLLPKTDGRDTINNVAQD